MHAILIPSDTGMHCIPVNQIVRIEALSNYSKIYFAIGKPLVISKVLLWCQNRLPQEMFARVHRSHLVNKLYIEKIHGGEYKTLQLTNGERVAVSRRNAGKTNKNTMALAG
jgi:two-component system LytT family response regulator